MVYQRECTWVSEQQSSKCQIICRYQLLTHAHFSLFSSNIDVEYDQAKNKGSLYEETKAIYFKMFCLMYCFKKIELLYAVARAM